MQLTDQRVTARIVRTDRGEVITEYNVGGIRYQSLETAFGDGMEEGNGGA